MKTYKFKYESTEENFSFILEAPNSKDALITAVKRSIELNLNPYCLSRPKFIPKMSFREYISKRYNLKKDKIWNLSSGCYDMDWTYYQMNSQARLLKHIKEYAK